MTTLKKQKLTTVAQFDDLMRCARGLMDDPSEMFLEFAYNQDVCRQKWLEALEECRRLQHELDKSTQAVSGLELKLRHARRMLDQEQKAKRRAEEERDALIKQMDMMRDLLLGDARNKLADETREKIAFIHSNIGKRRDSGTGRLNTITELNSTGSLLSDLSYSRTDDDLDVTSAPHMERPWKIQRPSVNDDEEPVKIKKRRSSSNQVIEINPTDHVIATTKLSIGKDGGPITATSIIEAVPDPNSQGQTGPSAPPTDKYSCLVSEPVNKKLRRIESEAFNIECRQHVFTSKPMLRDTCSGCNKRIRFGKVGLRCRECRSSVHNECQHLLKLPCVPSMNTPTNGSVGSIADYTPSVPPFVPALVVHCINEIEQRGMNEVGLYRVSGSERDVKILKEKFLKGKGVPNLSRVEIPVLCSTLKDFLRSLREPLITNVLWTDFTRAVDAIDPNDVEPALCQAIADLPQPNRDTLAFLLLHLQKVSKSPECRMPIANLSKVFAPTIVGYSTDDPDGATMISETILQTKVVEHLLLLPSDYWSSFINIKTITPGKCSSTHLRMTPSVESLSQQTPSGKYFNSVGSLKSTARKRRFFPTPPHRK